jgi:hypothetical protein
MVLSASGTSKTNQVMTVYQNDGTNSYRTVVTVTPTGATTGTVNVQTYMAPGVPSGGSWTSSTWTSTGTSNYSGTTNGVLYVNGNIGLQGSPKSGGLSGTIADDLMSGGNVVKASSWNIVTDATKSININGNITYNSMTTTTPPAAAAKSGVLGIVSNNVQIIRKDANGNELGNISVDATVMAYNTFDVEDPLLRNYPTPKNFYLLGGYIAKNPGTFAGIDANGNTLAGFYVNRYYDSRAASTPPPYFPSTSNQYKILSYQRVTSTLQ